MYAVKMWQVGVGTLTLRYAYVVNFLMLLEQSMLAGSPVAVVSVFSSFHQASLFIKRRTKYECKSGCF